VLQDIFFTVESIANSDPVWGFFSDILSESISAAKWQYVLSMYAFYQPDAPKGSFGLKDLNRILGSLYPKATDDGTQKLLLRFREMGLVWSVSYFLIYSQGAKEVLCVCDALLLVGAWQGFARLLF
jgi:hypothetical protein